MAGPPGTAQAPRSGDSRALAIPGPEKCVEEAVTTAREREEWGRGSPRDKVSPPWSRKEPAQDSLPVGNQGTQYTRPTLLSHPPRSPGSHRAKGPGKAASLMEQKLGKGWRAGLAGQPLPEPWPRPQGQPRPPSPQHLPSAPTPEPLPPLSVMVPGSPLPDTWPLASLELTTL